MMHTTAEQRLEEQTAVAQSATPQPAQPKTKRLVSLESFLSRYPNRQDAYKYEWNQGIVEKSPRTMNRDQLHIFQNLLKKFVMLPIFESGGALNCEVDMWIPSTERTRRADIAFLNEEQVQSSKTGELSPCAFIGEVISKNDQINEVERKLKDYFDNGVQVVWVILPRLQQVKVYHSIREITVCLDDDICSAAPVLPDFEISVRELFA
jgi:Uma2 family endonuclease